MTTLTVAWESPADDKRIPILGYIVIMKISTKPDYLLIYDSGQSSITTYSTQKYNLQPIQAVIYN